MDPQNAPLTARYSLAAARARVIADIARDRWTTPETMPVLWQIAEHLEAAAQRFDAHTPSPIVDLEACEALWAADTLAEQHPHTRFAVDFTRYVLALLGGRPLPLPGRLDPVSPQFARREARIAHTIVMLHADDEQQAEQPNAWIREVMDAWRTWVQLSAEVRVDNARPCNRHP
ncbi:hypothetical protein [Streptomyces anulatus]|uniref:hypothetical protein n=1 Tax=Streptomyces anulatus TaxID=1892 RepID=UPI001D189B3D|nr:hypothetical protein [Streptomyces anulatus]